MNLKEASRRLGVHYQSVYRWVRSGQLEAVRIGGRYDVSEAALTQFIARRDPVAAHPPTTERRRESDLSRSDVLEELEAFAFDPVVSVASVAAFAAQRGASVLGDLCVVAHLDDAGAVDEVSTAHADLDRAAYARAALEIGVRNPASPPAMAAFDYEERQVLRVAHVPQDRIQRTLPQELKQFWPKYAIYSLLAVPVINGQTLVGVIRFSRDLPGWPYSAEDEAFAIEFATRVGALFATATEIALAWRTRAALVETLDARWALADRHGRPDATELRRIVDSCVGTDRLPILLIDEQAHVAAINETFERETGHKAAMLIGRPFVAVTSPADSAAEQGAVDRIASGSLDFFDNIAGKILGDGSERVYAVHRGAIRAPDGTFRGAVAIWRPLHLTAEDASQLFTTDQ